MYPLGSRRRPHPLFAPAVSLTTTLRCSSISLPTNIFQNGSTGNLERRAGGVGAPTACQVAVRVEYPDNNNPPPDENRRSLARQSVRVEYPDNNNPPPDETDGRWIDCRSLDDIRDLHSCKSIPLRKRRRDTISRNSNRIPRQASQPYSRATTTKGPTRRGLL